MPAPATTRRARSAGGGLALHGKEDGALLACAADPGWTHLASVTHALAAPAVAAAGGGGAAVWDAGSLVRVDAFPGLHKVGAGAGRLAGAGSQTLTVRLRGQRVVR
jgi:hypothetical protein